MAFLPLTPCSLGPSWARTRPPSGDTLPSVPSQPPPRALRRPDARVPTRPGAGRRGSGGRGAAGGAGGARRGPPLAARPRSPPLPPAPSSSLPCPRWSGGGAGSSHSSLARGGGGRRGLGRERRGLGRCGGGSRGRARLPTGPGPRAAGGPAGRAPGELQRPGRLGCPAPRCARPGVLRGATCRGKLYALA